MAPKKLSDKDRKFVMQARPMNLAEVKLGELARDYASHDELRKLGEMLIQDHSDTNRQLMQIMRGSDVKAPDQMDPEHQKIEERLLELEGEDFDKEFVRTQMKDHQQMISLFEREAKEGEDPDLKEFAKGCVPVLQHHLQQLRGLASSMRM